jgi:hypothetical protein
VSTGESESTMTGMWTSTGVTCVQSLSSELVYVLGMVLSDRMDILWGRHHPPKMLSCNPIVQWALGGHTDTGLRGI